jgi:hypothetical protein
MATTVVGSGRLYLAPNASLGTSFGTHTVEEVTITQSGEAPVESQVAGSYALIAVKDAMKLELTATYVTTDIVSLPAHGTSHTLANMPSITWNSVANAINEVAKTGKWTLTALTNPVAYDQVSRCTATFTKWAGIVRS